MQEHAQAISDTHARA